MTDRGTIQQINQYVYGYCEICNTGYGEIVLVYERDNKLMCAQHTREYHKANPSAQPCDRCKAPGAVRYALRQRKNEYLCQSCKEAAA